MKFLKRDSKFSKVFRSNHEDTRRKLHSTFFFFCVCEYARRKEDMNWGSRSPWYVLQFSEMSFVQESTRQPRSPHGHPNLLSDRYNLDSFFSPFSLPLSLSHSPFAATKTRLWGNAFIKFLLGALGKLPILETRATFFFFFWQSDKNDFGFDEINDYIPKHK